MQLTTNLSINIINFFSFFLKLIFLMIIRPAQLYICFSLFKSLCIMAQIALWLLVFAGFSDLADGWIARTWISQASKLGSFLDPVADKLLVGTLFLSLAQVGLIPIPLTCLVIVRDIALVTAASYIRYCTLPPPVCISSYPVILLFVCLDISINSG
jgi:phosphatidylglycerophosphate synthase